MCVCVRVRGGVKGFMFSCANGRNLPSGLPATNFEILEASGFSKERDHGVRVQIFHFKSINHTSSTFLIYFLFLTIQYNRK